MTFPEEAFSDNLLRRADRAQFTDGIDGERHASPGASVCGSETAVGRGDAVDPAAREPPRVLTEVIRFGTNPGNLRMFAFVPDRLAPSRPLVLVLHGCTQTAAGYDAGAGWGALREQPRVA